MTDLAAVVESNARSIWSSFDNWLDRNTGTSVTRFLGHVRSALEALRDAEITLADGRRVSLQDRFAEVYGLPKGGELSTEANARIAGAFDTLGANVAKSVDDLEKDVIKTFMTLNAGAATEASATATNVTSRYDELAKAVSSATGSARANVLRDFEELKTKLPQLAVDATDKAKASWLDFKDAASGVLSDLFDISGAQTFAERMVRVFDRMADRIVDQVLRPLEDAIGSALNKAFAPSSGSNIFGSILGSLGLGALFGGGNAVPIPTPKPAFASGGSFTVGGAGGGTVRSWRFARRRASGSMFGHRGRLPGPAASTSISTASLTRRRSSATRRRSRRTSRGRWHAVGGASDGLP